MNGCQIHISLLQGQYPDQNSLCNPILLSACHSWKSNGLNNFIQIIKVSKLDWMCVSNYNWSPHTVDIFDSIRGFSVNFSSLKNQIAAILKTPTSSFNMNFIYVQTQMGQMIAASLL